MHQWWTTKFIQEIYIAGGAIGSSHKSKQHGNVYTIPGNTKSEFNFFLDPEAAKITLESDDFNIFLAPLDALHGRNSLASHILKFLEAKQETPEAKFVHKLLYTVQQLKHRSSAYIHTVSDIFHMHELSINRNACIANIHTIIHQCSFCYYKCSSKIKNCTMYSHTQRFINPSQIINCIIYHKIKQSTKAY